MLSAKRNRQLRRRLFERGSIRVSEEARAFGVSEETIRRDIKAMAAEGVADAVFGGACCAPPPPWRRSASRPWTGAGRFRSTPRRRSARPRPPWWNPARPSSSTPDHHARAGAAPAQLRGLTVITNAIPVAQVCATFRNSVTSVIGGKLVPGSMGMIGPQAQRELSQFSADWAFLGAAAVDVERGFTSADPFEAEIKRAMIAAAAQTAMLADGAKFGSRRFATFAGPRVVTRLYHARRAGRGLALLEAAGGGDAMPFRSPGDAAMSHPASASSSYTSPPPWTCSAGCCARSCRASGSSTCSTTHPARASRQRRRPGVRGLPRWSSSDAKIADERGVGLILNACSSVGELARWPWWGRRRPIVRVDAEMAREAVRRGTGSPYGDPADHPAADVGADRRRRGGGPLGRRSSACSLPERYEARMRGDQAAMTTRSWRP